MINYLVFRQMCPPMRRMVSCVGFMIWVVLLALWVPAEGQPSRDQPTSATMKCIGSYNERIENFRQVEAPDCHTYLFLRQGFTLRVLDASDPAHPAEIAWLRFDSEITTLAVRWPALYVGSGGLKIYDITDPAHPKFNRAVSGQQTHLSFDLMGDFLLTEDQNNHLIDYTVYNIHDRFNPVECLADQREAGGNMSPEWCLFATDGKRLFSASRHNAVETTMADGSDESGNDDETSGRMASIKDVTSSPTTLGQVFVADEDCLSLALKDTKLIAAASDSSATLTVADLGTSRTVWVYICDYGVSVERKGQDEAAPATSSQIICERPENESTIKIFEKTNATSPTSPTLRTTVGEHAGAKQFKFDGRRGYLIDEDDGLQVLDLADPARVRCLARLSLGLKEPVIRAAADGLVYIGTKDAPGLRVYRCADAAPPVLCDEYQGDTGPMSIQGHQAYVAAGKGGLQILDITNPASIQLLGRYHTRHAAADLVTSGTLVYVLAKDLLVVDVANPVNPTLLTTTKLDDANQGESHEWFDEDFDNTEWIMKRLGPALYVIGAGIESVKVAGSFCHVVDVTNPTQPRLLPNPLVVDPLSDPDDKQDTRVPSAPPIETEPPSPYAGWLLSLPAHNFYVGSWQGWHVDTLAIYDLADPLHPRFIGDDNALQSSAGGAALRKGTLYHADGHGGLVILQPAKP